MDLGATRDREGVWRLLSPDSPLRRHYEELAANLAAEGGGAKSVVVTAPEPGAGCTSVCLGLGAALAGSGRPAAVVDCNLDRPHLHRVVGGTNFVGLTSGLDSRRSLESYGREILPGLLVVPTGPVTASPRALLEGEGLVEAIRRLEEGREMVLLDAPIVGKLLGTPALLGGFDGILLVVHASRTSRKVAREATDDLIEAGANLLGVVLNGAHGSRMS
ncbi:Tyrosine-protein kinase YwqD [Rubrobacter xylanophilus DSM 9941]|uniref:CpsD/CapB family tyrosine-protein kinase n=1 Tax=Rubrobacter xylanophilus TaxID=49319 RepID=UPI001C63EF35|nr:CpsD/CapB family tyrosine-protein kinase [Rubrobacter xylanophilus]QYJ15748.1 Tyrosine-protein kinase YwqD [Rubrobacter xylanophilus DSM 9941]